jgi:Fe(3+) dicitrate transport protein
MNLLSHTLLVLCTCLLVNGQLLYAQEEDGSADYLSPFNVIGSKEDVPELEGTGAVLDSSDLKPFFHTDVNEVFRQVPGVYLRPEEGYGLFPNISLRGVDSHRSAKVTILEDGIPSSPSPFSDPAAYYSPTAGRMAGFEILKGSSQLSQGPNTTGGIINYLSTPIPEEQRSHLRASYGEHNERIAHAYSGGKTNLGTGRLGYLLEVFDQRTDGFKSINALGNAVGRDAPVSKNDITLKLGYEFGEGNYLEFKAGRTDLDADVSYIGLSPEDFASNPYQRYHNTKLDNMSSEQTRYYLRYLKEIDEETNLKATVFHNELDRDWYKVGKVRLNNSTNDGGGIFYEENKSYPLYAQEKWFSIGKGAFNSLNHVNLLRGSGDMNDTTTFDGSGQVRYKHNDRNYKNTGIQLSLQKEWEKHVFEVGGRYTKDHYTYKDYTEDIYDVSNLGNAGASLDYNSSSFTPMNEKMDRISRVWETYLTDEISIDRLTFTPGIRYTSAEYEYNNKRGTVSDVLVGAGVTYELDDHLLFGGVHQGHALPGYSAAGGSLEEERSVGYELGSRGSIEFVNYELAYFHTSIKDMIAVPSLASGLGESSRNIGKATVDGVELLLSTDLNRNGSFGLPLSVAATLTNAEFDSDTGTDAEDRYSGGSPGNSIPCVPNFQYNARIGVVLEDWSSYLNYHWQDQVYTNAANNAEISDYGILDWSGFYLIAEGVEIFAKITNLTDKKYVASDMPDGLRPGAPRTATFGMEFNF